VTRNDVLIIGAGPSGLFAAAELARHSMEARLIEREQQPHRETCATTIQPGTLEILENVVLLPTFVDTAEHIRCSRLYGPDMSEVASTSHDGIECRCAFQCSLPQYETRRILERHFLSFGGVAERGGKCQGAASRAVVSRLDAVWRNLAPRAYFRNRRRHRVARVARPTVVHTRADLPQPQRRSGPCRPSGGRYRRDPSGWPHQFPVPVRQRGSICGARRPPLLVSHSGTSRRSGIRGNRGPRG